MAAAHEKYCCKEHKTLNITMSWQTLSHRPFIATSYHLAVEHGRAACMQDLHEYCTSALYHCSKQSCSCPPVTASNFKRKAEFTTEESTSSHLISSHRPTSGASTVASVTPEAGGPIEQQQSITPAEGKFV